VLGFVNTTGYPSAERLVQGQALDVSGWAADTVSGAPVQNVTVAVDGISVGTATLGATRSDVAQAYNRSDYTHSGWSSRLGPMD
jgi:hypothetical protein